MIGAWDKCDSGWIPTQQDFLDLNKPADWQYFFQRDSVDAMVAWCGEGSPEAAVSDVRIAWEDARGESGFVVRT